ncbi:MAG: prepilin-type N-terminal cleavage/methylation domain-containing protein [Candidatus Gastranaerophilales bacterium]|nr:prepilin-type N-terminal cleavage/methylation domain-containing protein [Candidatus Gastranaerophilales bacterium]
MKKSAFSLVEMLMALLVASLLMAALAPVVTKRMNDTLMVDDISTPGLKVWAEPGEYTFTVPAQTEYLQIQGSAGGGGGGGASIRKIGPIEISSGSFTVPKGVSKVTFTLIGGGGGGGAGYGKVLNDTCD